MKQNLKKFSTYLLVKTQELPDKQPKFVVTLNGVEQEPYGKEDDCVTFNMLSIFGNNRLTIDFLNKKADDTKIDDNGNIINDLNLELYKFSVEDHNLTDKIKQQVKYFTCDNQFEETFGFMHKNGQLIVEFQCPLFYFLRDHIQR